MKARFTIFFCGLLAVACCLIGCEPLARKFIRKPKKDSIPREEMVVSPIEYKAPDLSKEERYRQGFLYWRSWHDELIESLSSGLNHKKQMECVSQAIANLEQMKALIIEGKQGILSGFIASLNNLKFSIEKDAYGRNASFMRMEAERIKRNILREFPSKKIKDYLM